MQYSSTKWETSYFGGYYKVLFDYPEIKVPYEIERDIPKNAELRSYTANKLIDIFLLKVNEHDVINILLRDAEITKRAIFMGEQEMLKVNSLSITKALRKIDEKETELKNLLSYYRKIILETEFFFPLPEDKKGKKEGKGEGEEKDKENSDSDNSGTMLLQAMEKAIESLGRVAAMKTKWVDEEGMISGDFKKRTIWKMMKGSSQLKYTDLEVLSAGRLSTLLDISFEPEKDIVNNLKVGKLDARKIAETQAGNLHVYYTEQENQITRPFSVAILMDESGSMSGNRASAQHSIMKVLWKTFSDILPPDKIYVYGHSTVFCTNVEDRYGHVPEIRIYNDKYNHNFETAISNQFNNERSGNYDGPVIECVYDKIRSLTEDNIIFITISDGAPSGSGYGGRSAVDELKAIIEKCKRDGFVTVGVGVDYGQVKEIYNYHTIVKDMSQMAKQVSTLVNTVVKTEFQ